MLSQRAHVECKFILKIIVDNLNDEKFWKI